VRQLSNGFRNRIDARVSIERLRRHQNAVRPHSILGLLKPAEYKEKIWPTRTNNARHSS
jgi:hypothetical protein